MSKEKNSNSDSIELAMQAGAAHEVIDRYGSASKQHLTAYSGHDNEFGTTLKRGLKKTAESKVNPEYRNQNIKQQAGFAAEDKYTARQNAEKIIKGETDRYVRTDDLCRVNDPLHDHVRVDSNGVEIQGSGEQMKFVGSDPKACLKKLESEEYQKYFDADSKVTVPSDYYKDVIKEADNEISNLERQLARAKQNNNNELASVLEKKIEKVKKIKDSIKDSGISNEEALNARLHPKSSTAKDIAKLSHRAGLEQAKTGAAISGAISLIGNTVDVLKGKKSLPDAAKDVAFDTAKGAAVGYTTAFAGSALKASMQNSKSQWLRSLSKTNASAAIVTSVMDVGKSFYRYVNGEISGADCLIEIGEKGTSHIGAAMFGAVGQAVIPIPVVGALVGSMVGYALTALFYESVVCALKEAQIAHDNRIRIERECQEAIVMIRKYRAEMNFYVQEYMRRYTCVFSDAFSLMDQAFLSSDVDKFIGGANKITEVLGGKAQYSNMKEFNSFMYSSNSLNL